VERKLFNCLSMRIPKVLLSFPCVIEACVYTDLVIVNWGFRCSYKDKESCIDIVESFSCDLSREVVWGVIDLLPAAYDGE
jgi:hypothetical protein